MAVRSLARLGLTTPALLAATLTLALGAAATGVTLALYQAAVVRPVAFPAARELVDLLAEGGDAPGARHSLYPADFVAFRSARGTLREVGGYAPAGTRVLGDGDRAARLRVTRADAAYFHVLGLPPAAGRLFLAEDERPGAPAVALLSARLWRTRFTTAPDIVGRTLILDGATVTVVGVLAADVGYRSGGAELFVPLALPADAATDRSSAWLGAVARLAPGATIDDARHDLAALATALDRQLPTGNVVRPSLLPLRDAMVGALRPRLRWALAAALLVLALVTATVAALLLGRAFAEAPRDAVRVCLGAAPGLLARRRWREATALALLASPLALLLAQAEIALLPDLRGRLLYPDVELSLRGLAVLLTVGATWLAAFVAALPAVALSRSTGIAALTADPTSSASPRRTLALQRGLVVVQLALTCLLLAASGALAEGILGLLHAGVGFDASRVSVVELGSGRGARAAEQEETDLLRRVGTLATVEAAGLANVLPGEGWGFHPTAPGAAAENDVEARFELVDEGYLAALGLATHRGRWFTEPDGPQSERVAVLNDSASRRLFGDGHDPIGRMVSFDGTADLHRVIGVVGDVRSRPGADPTPIVYFARRQHAGLLADARFRPVVLFVRTTAAAALAPALREILRTSPLGPGFGPPVALARHHERELSSTLLPLQVGAACAGLGLALAALGVFAVSGLAVGLRWRELGIRSALGARPVDLTRHLLGGALRLAAVGMLAGALASLLAAPLAGALLGPQPRPGIATVLFTAALLVGAVLLSALPAARRAARVDPVTLLHPE